MRQAMTKGINITIDRDLWDNLNKFAHDQSIKRDKRYPTIKALRLAIKVLLRLEVKEINQVLKRNTRNCG